MPNQDALDELAEVDGLLFADAIGEERHRVPDNDGDRSAEEVEGWNGEALGLDEIAHTNLNGFDPNGWDRPIQSQHDAELAAYEQEIAQLRQQNQHLHILANPEYQGRVELERQRQIGEMFRDPDAALNRMNYLQTQANGGVLEALNVNLAAAHRQYGKAFERAYASLTGLDPTNEVDRRTVQAVLSQPDPGRAVMEWHGRTSRGMGSRTPPPFARGLRRSEPADDSNDRGPEEMSDWGTTSSIGGGEEYEKNLMASMWDDFR